MQDLPKGAVHRGAGGQKLAKPKVENPERHHVHMDTPAKRDAINNLNTHLGTLTKDQAEHVTYVEMYGKICKSGTDFDGLHALLHVNGELSAAQQAAGPQNGAGYDVQFVSDTNTNDLLRVKRIRETNRNEHLGHTAIYHVSRPFGVGHTGQPVIRLPLWNIKQHPQTVGGTHGAEALKLKAHPGMGINDLLRGKFAGPGANEHASTLNRLKIIHEREAAGLTAGGHHPGEIAAAANAAIRQQKLDRLAQRANETPMASADTGEQRMFEKCAKPAPAHAAEIDKLLTGLGGMSTAEVGSARDFSNGEIVKVRRNGSEGVNHSYWVSTREGHSGLMKGYDLEYGIPENEVYSKLLSVKLGARGVLGMSNLVPTVTMRDTKDGRMSIMERTGPDVVASGAANRVDFTTPTSRNSLSSLLVLTTLTGNTDRHSGNFRVNKKTGEFIAIDNGFACKDIGYRPDDDGDLRMSAEHRAQRGYERAVENTVMKYNIPEFRLKPEQVTKAEEYVNSPECAEDIKKVYTGTPFIKFAKRKGYRSELTDDEIVNEFTRRTMFQLRAGVKVLKDQVGLQGPK